jgi:hypothetical protein
VTATINYDRTVSNLIDELSATGHVTHRSYRKTSVTFHHNAGRLSHQGVLNVWRTRPASAHFDVDSAGAVAQYVKVNEYAWAAGNLVGNQTSIHIELANLKLGPTWEVGETTWKNGARLAGWLFAKVIGVRPTKNNVHYHSHWSATTCAGPYMKKIYDKVLKEVQEAYEYFRGTKPSPSSPRPSTPTKKSVTEVAKAVIAGDYGNGNTRVQRLRSEGYDPNAVQKEVNRILAGDPPVRKTVSQLANEVIAGQWGSGMARVANLTKAGYNASAVQKEVNRLMTPKGEKKPKLSINQIAAQVIRGEWGDGAERKSKLLRAGYNYNAVQSEVNRRLR